MEQRFKYNGRGQKPPSNQSNQGYNNNNSNSNNNSNGPQNQFRDREREEEEHYYQAQNKRRQQKVYQEYDTKQVSQDNNYQAQKNNQRNQQRDQNKNNNSNNDNRNQNNGQKQNGKQNEFYPRNQNRQGIDDYDDDEDDDNNSFNNSRNSKKKNVNRNNNQNRQQKQYDSSDDDYSDGRRRNKKEKKIDPNGHNPNANVDQQYDRSKIEHYFNSKDIKFSKDKRFNIYHQRDEEYFHNSKNRNGSNKFESNNSNSNNYNNQKNNEEFDIESIVDQVDFQVNLEDIFRETNMEEYEWNNLYQLFKLSEKKNSLFFTMQSDNQVIFDKQEMETEIFKLFQQLARVLILSDLETASEKKIDQRLWDIYKKKIEYSKKFKLVSTNIQDQLHIFDSKIQFLRGLLKDVIEKYKSELCSEIKQKNQKRRIIANLCCYFGELIELKEKVSRTQTAPNIKNMHFAAGQYMKAISIYPFCGKFFLVLATLSYMSDDQFSAIYWCIRALSSQQSYPCKENLQEFLEINRQKCFQFMQEHNSYGKIDKRDTFKLFILHFLSFVNIVLTKIGIENMHTHAPMFEYLQQHLQLLQSQIQSQQDVSLKDQTTLLTYVIMMVVFALSKFQEYIKLKEGQVLDVKILENDILASNCLKYTYGILNMILELYVNYDVPFFTDLVIPIICYFVSYQAVSDYLFTKFSHFQTLFNKILQKTKQRFAEFEKQKPKSYYEKLCDNYLCETEIQMIGYQPFNHYFENNKDKFKILDDDSLQYPLKLFIILDKLPKIESFKIMDEDEQDDSNNHDQEDFFFLKTTPQKENNSDQESKQVIIIDGMNVAIRYGQSTFCAKGLQIVVDFWLNHQAEVLVFLPDFCFSAEQIEKKRQKFQKEKIPEKFKTLPDEVETLIKLRDQGYATGIPNQSYDDSYMIDYARKKNAFIMTNDRYNDHIQKYKNDPKQMEIVKQWIRNNCMSFTFVKDELQPDPDFIQKRTKISLEKPYQ
ncbi:hypothetical protein ABPG74_004766 [Tetrahymena malaccensis]